MNLYSNAYLDLCYYYYFTLSKFFSFDLTGGFYKSLSKRKVFSGWQDY